jgi:protoheme IX farnesyltransferase
MAGVFTKCQQDLVSSKYLTADGRLAMFTFGFSIIYLFGLFAVLMADHYLLNIIKGLYWLIV